MTRRLLFAFYLIVLSGPFATGQHQFQRGLTWEDNRYNTLPVRYGAVMTLPASKSLKAFYPRVISEPKQDKTGVAWACVWNGRTAAEAIACNIQEPANVLQVAFSPAYNYGLIRKGGDCKEAISVIDLLESMEKNGTPYWSEYREFCAVTVPPELYPLATRKKLSGYIKLFNSSDEQAVKILSIKQALLSHNAVLAGIICPPSFQLATEFWQPRETPDTEYGGHVVNIVGYDDTKYGGAFEVLNTWGKDWGIQGYTWVRYKDMSDYTKYGFSIFQVGSAACATPIAAEVSFRDVVGKEMPVTKRGDAEYMLTQTYPSGTEFSIVMSTSRPAYVYSFGVDPTNAFFPMFPQVATTLPITFGPLKAPDGNTNVMLTDPPGRNVIYFVFSPNAIDLNNCIELLKNEVDFTARKVESVLSTNTATATWQSSKIGFSSHLSGPVAMKVILNQSKK